MSENEPYTTQLEAILLSGRHDDKSPFTVLVEPRDAFGRLRTGDPETLFDSTHHYDKAPLLYTETTAGDGAATHLPNEASVRMRVATSGDSVIRQSRQYLRYQPGKSQLAMFTFDAGAAVTNARQRVGLFDTQNGVFIQRDGDDISLVLRTYTSGTASDSNAADQADWNIDPLDGTGPSGHTLDFTKAQIFWVMFQWLGVGAVTAGFDINGELVPVHRFNHANLASSVYATTMNLPVRYETVATGALSANSDLKHICSTVISEGGFEDARGYPEATGNGATTIAVTTRRPILTIRPAATFNSIVNRAMIVLDSLDITAATNSAYWELVYGGTLTTTPDWNAVSASSTMEVDVASTVITGGTTIQSGFVTSGQANVRQAVRHGIASRLPLTLDAAGSNPITLSVVVTSMNATSNVAAALNWRSLR